MATKNETTIIAEPGKQELFITREFDAPRELLFKAFIEPELVAQWLGPRRMIMEIETYEPRFGGAYRFTHCDSNIHKYGFRGVFHEVAVPERIIRTFEYEGLAEKGHASLETVRFEALPGERSKLCIQAVFQSAADRDSMIKSGMERGVNEGHERLDELLERELAK